MLRIVFWDVLPCKIIVDRRLFYTAVHPRRQFWTSYSPPWELEISHALSGIQTHDPDVRAIITPALSATMTSIKMHKTIILKVVHYRSKTWSLTLRTEQKLREFENWVLRKIVGVRAMEWWEAGEKCICGAVLWTVLDLVLLGWSYQEEWN
jgi:hypothetical protein